MFETFSIKNLHKIVLIISVIICCCSIVPINNIPLLESAATPQETLDPRLPYDSLNILKISIHAESYQHNNEPPEKVYFSYIKLGEPSHTVRAIFDTSTSENWYPKWTWNPFARNLVYPMGHRCSESVTCTGPAGTNYDVDYQGTILSGEAYSDQLILGSNLIDYHYNNDSWFPLETRSGQVTVKQRFLAIFSASDGRQKKDEHYPFMILGLAPVAESVVSGGTTLLKNIQKPKQNLSSSNASISTHSTLTHSKDINHSGFIEKRAYGTLIDRELFSIWFKPLGKDAEILFGSSDKRRYTGSINYYQLSGSTKLWQLSGSQIWLGRRLLSKPQGYTITINTGVNDLYGPAEIVEELYKELNATLHDDGKTHVVNCHSAPNLPELLFQFSEDVSLNLQPKYYIRTMYASSKSFSHMRETCYISIRPHDSVSDWTMGTHFLEAYYTVYDVTNRRIGFATSAA